MFHLDTEVPDTSWNNIKVFLHQQFSLLPTATCGATHLMYRYQQKGEGMQEFIFKFSELIQAGSNHEPNDNINPLKYYMYAQKLFSLATNAKILCDGHLTLQKAIDYAQKVQREFLPVEDIQKTELDTVTSINVSADNEHMKNRDLQTLHIRNVEKGHYRKDYPKFDSTSWVPDQNMASQPYSPPTTVTQTVTLLILALWPSLKNWQRQSKQIDNLKGIYNQHRQIKVALHR